MRLTIDHETDGTCGLRCEANHDGFAGRGSAWFVVDEVRRFCDALDDYPLAPHGAVLAPACGPAPADVTMRLVVRRTDSVGGIELVATLADSAVTNVPSMTRRSAVVCIPVTYESLRRFNQTLRDLLDRRAVDAELPGPASR